MCVCVCVCAQIKAAAKSNGSEIPGKKKRKPNKPWCGEKTEIRYSILFGCVTTLDRIC